MSLPPTPIPDPCSYDDYRLFLEAAIIAGWGQIEDGASADFARDAHCTHGYVTNILTGRKHLQDEVLDGYVAALGLEGERRSAFLLLVRRAAPLNQTDAADIEERLLALRARWLAERDAEAARRGPSTVEPHPAVAAYRQDSRCATPDPAIAVGLQEALAMTSAKGKHQREYRYDHWSVPTAALGELYALVDQGADQMKALFHQGAAESSPQARRYVWQTQLLPATEPVPAEIAAPEASPEPVAAPEELEDPCAPDEPFSEDGSAAPDGTPPSVFDFLGDHRYLEAWIAARTVKIPEYTVSRLAQRCHVSASYIHQILAGGRNPNGALITALRGPLDHTPEQEAHYTRLVRLRAEGSDIEVEAILWEIVEALVKRRHRPPTPVVEALMGLPALDTLCQLVRTPDFREDAACLARRVRVSPHQAAQGLAFLERARVVVRTSHGRLRMVDRFLEIGGPDAEHRRRLVRLWLLAAQRAAPQVWRPHLLWRVEGPLSVPLAHQMTAQASELNMRVQAACADLERQANPAPDAVIQLQFQVFPQLPRPTRRRRKAKPSGV